MCVRMIWIPLKKFEESGKYIPPRIKMAGGMYVPCGHCPECLKSRQRQWYSRFKLEERYWSKKGGYVTLYFTLTYSNANIKFTRKELQNDYRAFLKQIKRITGYKPRYYICSEYGTLHNRVHFHGLLFGFPIGYSLIQLQNLLAKCWHRGFVNVSYASGKSLNYVSKYVTKDMEKSGKYGVQTITACSKRPALGLLGISLCLSSYLDSNSTYCLRFDGYRYPVPRYIASKILSEDTINLKKSRAVLDGILKERENSPARARSVYQQYNKKLSEYAFAKHKKSNL